MFHHSLTKLTLAALLTLPLATTGCTKGQSPTEPALDLESASVTGNSVTSVTEERRGRGGDDRGGNGEANDDNGGRRGGRNDDDNNGDRGRRRRGRGGNGNGNGNNGGNNGGENRPRAGQEFEAAVASVNGNAIVLTNGTRVIVDGQTQWIARGDLHSLSEISGSLAAGNNPRVEGRGTRQGDGAILALTIKAEDER